jgi:putative transposase
VEKIRKNR